MSDEKYLVVVTADTNDADYVTEISKVDKKTVEKLQVLLEKIPEKAREYNKSFLWTMDTYTFGDEYDPYKLYTDYLTEDEIEWLGGYFPYNGYIIEGVDVYRYTYEYSCL